ncbi:hypothetical protein AFCDBAGC_3362 [Methylobacterium cerastii]|uniref:Uncharacterized protein n=1 Tax=Methylobacterium cerastii TaxID=932741 RepID=A0ABQ4QJR1_9HYPH|nr:hypothetical protein AFCDBAGC_3362 [Methylobacterium cerastii]
MRYGIKRRSPDRYLWSSRVEGNRVAVVMD